MRQIVLDTETTGIGHESGHRIIEIGCIELFERKLTKRSFHTYLNPERKVDEGAFRVHGISSEFLADKPLFKDVASKFMEFIKGAELIIHNAAFDVGFLNAELKLIKSKSLIHDLSRVCDTLALARDKHPGQRNSLDALCKRYEIDNSNRTLHGALLDAQILASVYLAMTGGQANLFDDDIEIIRNAKKQANRNEKSLVSNAPILLATQHELEKHEEFIQFLLEKSGINYWVTE
ncbi:MAG: DNA polymerase III subunit epsilon [Tatlockia sp.]|nr:DNA polymerase III subunit epsilon [Tatlockia sp.]